MEVVGGGGSMAFDMMVKIKNEFALHTEKREGFGTYPFRRIIKSPPTKALLIKLKNK